MQKFINVALAVLIIFKVVKSATFSRTFSTNKPNVNKVKGKFHPINLRNYKQGFSKNSAKIHFYGYYFFSYFYGFGEESFNLQESVCEKIHLAPIDLQE